MRAAWSVSVTSLCAYSHLAAVSLLMGQTHCHLHGPAEQEGTNIDNTEII